MQNALKLFSKNLTVQIIVNYFFIIAIAFVIPLYFGKNVFSDPDTAWHIKAGQIIWSLKQVPILDTLTYTSDQQWYNISWAWDVLVYLIYNYYGELGLIYFQALLFTLIVALSFSYIRSYILFNNDTIAVVVTLSSLIIWDLLYLRPQLLSYILCLISLKYLRNLNWQSVIILALIALIWINIHGSFITFYIMVVFYIIEEIYNKNYARLNKLALLLFLSSVALFINPIGYKIIYAITRTLNSATMPYIMEWQPFTFGYEYSFTLILMILLIFNSFSERQISLAVKLLTFFWLIAALSSKRNFGFFAIYSTGYLPYILDPIIRKHPSKYNLGYKFKISISILFILACIVYPNFSKYNKNIAPLKAIDFVNKYCKNAKIFNDYNYGGYLALWLYDNKYFIDGRAGVAFSESLIDEYLSSFYVKKDVSHLVNKYGIDILFVNKDFKDSAKHFQLLQDWYNIYNDQTISIYKNKTSNVCINDE